MADKVTSPHTSQITDYLYISAWPRGEHVEEIVALGVRLVLSMHWIRPTKMLGHPPIELLWLPTIDKPFFPMPIKTLNKGVQAALPVISQTARVYYRSSHHSRRAIGSRARRNE